MELGALGVGSDQTAQAIKRRGENFVALVASWGAVEGAVEMPLWLPRSHKKSHDHKKPQEMRMKKPSQVQRLQWFLLVGATPLVPL
jgi:hypothetical protein